MELLDLQLRRAEAWAAHQDGAGSGISATGSATGGAACQASAAASLADLGGKLLAGEALGAGEARLAGALARQEPALCLALSLLLNMAEGGPGVEQKMVKKVGQGVALLGPQV